MPSENLEGTNLLKRSLPEDERRRINLVVGKTLGTLRRESQLCLSLIEKFQLQYNDDEDEEEAQNKNEKQEERRLLLLGPKLGQGGFSSVYVVNETTAVKFLSKSTLESRGDKQLQIAAEDLVREAYFLHRLHHPNIIAFKGEGSLEDIASYYILMDRIYCGLKQTVLEEFHPKVATMDNGQLGIRLVYGLQIVSALQYLHSHKIIYRDLKLDNLGLNHDNQVVLYDFGLAKELKGPGSNNGDGKYNLTGNTGSWAYMAPEVAKNFRYNLSADVFSFAMVLWELCKGAEVRSQIASQHDIVYKNERPRLTREWPLELEDHIMREGWSWNPNGRPSMKEIQERLTVLAQEACTKPKVLEVLGEMSGAMKAMLLRTAGGGRGLSPKRGRTATGRNSNRSKSPHRAARGKSPKRTGGDNGGGGRRVVSPIRIRGISPKRK